MSKIAHGITVDVAGGNTGGAARWRRELMKYLSTANHSITSIGENRQATPSWIVRREQLARNASLAVATNNVSFGRAGEERRVLLRNALHFLHHDELHLLHRMPARFRMQVPIVRMLACRADEAIVPCSQMAERVIHHLPSLRNRVKVMPHPVSQIEGLREPSFPPIILVPVVPGPYKNLMPQLRALLDAMKAVSHTARVHVTAEPADLPGYVVEDVRVSGIGHVQESNMEDLWRTASAVFYPSTVESFGYPLAEARVNGIPVIAPDSPQAHEIAGDALCGYVIGSPTSMIEALLRTNETVKVDPQPFERRAYFEWLFARTRTHSQELTGI
jgi:glycosyltransferase involved in cell wall biosynthesis